MAQHLDVAHPLIAPLPRGASALGKLIRPLIFRKLRGNWKSTHSAETLRTLRIELPDGSVELFGDRNGAAAATALVQVVDDRFFLRLALRGEMGAGESYVAGEWTSPDVVGVVRLFLRATGARGFESPLTLLGQLPDRIRHLRSANTLTGSQRNISAHYDLGNDFYQLFLDESMTYSAGVWRTGATSLHAAQQAKYAALCRQLDLRSTDHLVEIGCGWGSMAIHAAQTTGCKVTAITISRAQYELATKRVREAGLAGQVSIEQCDYRKLARPAGGFDKLVSIEMIEAVGYENLPTYFATCAGLLAERGKMAIQAITMPDERFESYRRGVDWMQTYIFPGSLIPSLGAIRKALPLDLAEASTSSIGTDYAPTLASWRETFAANRKAVLGLGFDEPFIRAWHMYLSFSEAAFAERTLDVHHISFDQRGASIYHGRPISTAKPAPLPVHNSITANHHEAR